MGAINWFRDIFGMNSPEDPIVRPNNVGVKHVAASVPKMPPVKMPREAPKEAGRLPGGKYSIAATSPRKTVYKRSGAHEYADPLEMIDMDLDDDGDIILMDFDDDLESVRDAVSHTDFASSIPSYSSSSYDSGSSNSGDSSD